MADCFSGDVDKYALGLVRGEIDQDARANEWKIHRLGWVIVHEEIGLGLLRDQMVALLVHVETGVSCSGSRVLAARTDDRRELAEFGAHLG